MSPESADLLRLDHSIVGRSDSSLEFKYSCSGGRLPEESTEDEKQLDGNRGRLLTR